VHIYERTPSAMLAREVRTATGKDRKSLNTRDRKLAEQLARALARRLAELRHAGQVGPVTLGQAWTLYQLHRLPLLSESRQRHVQQHAAFLLAHLGRDFRLEDLSQSHLDAFAAARRSGALRSKKRAADTPATVRDGTIRQNLNWLASLLRWARGYRVNGKPLVVGNPLEGLVLPQEKNVRRPVASQDRYERTQAVAATVDPSGRFACLLALVRFTGRRINAVVQLRVADLCLSREAVVRALAASALDERLADHMPHGAIRWREETDKQGFEELTALSTGARAALDAYLATRPSIGDVPLFPRTDDPTRPINKMQAAYWLTRAETRAKLPKLERGGFHAYRRLWASERRHLPDVDVAKAGGWRDLATMKRSYQHPDPATVLEAIENAPPKTRSAPKGRGRGPHSDTADSQVQSGQ
jgi:integrase